jgi:hypothetical protein
MSVEKVSRPARLGQPALRHAVREELFDLGERAIARLLGHVVHPGFEPRPGQHDRYPRAHGSRTRDANRSVHHHLMAWAPVGSLNAREICSLWISLVPSQI